MNVCVCVCTFLVPTETKRGCWSPWKLELKEVDSSVTFLMWLLRTEPRSFARTASALYLLSHLSSALALISVSYMCFLSWGLSESLSSFFL